MKLKEADVGHQGTFLKERGVGFQGTIDCREVTRKCVAAVDDKVHSCTHLGDKRRPSHPGPAEGQSSCHFLKEEFLSKGNVCHAIGQLGSGGTLPVFVDS